MHPTGDIVAGTIRKYAESGLYLTPVECQALLAYIEDLLEDSQTPCWRCDEQR